MSHYHFIEVVRNVLDFKRTNQDVLYSKLLRLDLDVLNLIRDGQLELDHSTDTTAYEPGSFIVKDLTPKVIVTRALPVFTWRGVGNITAKIKDKSRRVYCADGSRPVMTGGIIHTVTDKRPKTIHKTYDTETWEVITPPAGTKVIWKHDHVYLVSFDTDRGRKRYRLQGGIMGSMNESPAIWVMARDSEGVYFTATSSVRFCRQSETRYLCEIKGEDFAWRYWVEFRRQRPEIVEIVGHRLVWWDYSDARRARKMECELYTEERVLVGRVNVPVEMADLILAYLVPYF